MFGLQVCKIWLLNKKDIAIVVLVRLKDRQQYFTDHSVVLVC